MIRVNLTTGGFKNFKNKREMVRAFEDKVRNWWIIPSKKAIKKYGAKVTKNENMTKELYTELGKVATQIRRLDFRKTQDRQLASDLLKKYGYGEIANIAI